jgi:hypothetical protein
LKQTRELEERFLLYIDILNFSNLVSQKGQVEELYDIINKLNVHSHEVFNTIIFSDTILVYNKLHGRNLSDVNYVVMYLCEFAQDLFYRLIGRDVHFRAYITCDDFAHYQMKNIQNVFYGNALIAAYQAEKKIQCMGLFMNKRVVPYSDVFRTARFNRECDFVYIMQSLQTASFEKLDYPLDPILIVDTDEIWFLAYDIHYLKTIYQHKNDHALQPRVRQKYEKTWRMLLNNHEGIMAVLEEHNFDPKAICRCDWSEATARVGTKRGFFG